MNSNIPSKVLKIPDCPSDIQVIPVEINLKKQKWLVIAIFTPPSQCKNYFITELTKILDKCRGSYENTVILGDFNVQPTNQILKTLEDNSFVNLIKSNACFKSKPGSCIDLILTNKPKGFQNSGVMEPGVSGHHALIFSFLKATFTKCHQISYNIETIKNLKYTHFYKMLNNYQKKLSIPNGKNFCENAKQTRSSQNESDLRKS